jgi:hypothetical protein
MSMPTTKCLSDLPNDLLREIAEYSGTLSLPLCNKKFHDATISATRYSCALKIVRKVSLLNERKRTYTPYRIPCSPGIYKEASEMRSKMTLSGADVLTLLRSIGTYSFSSESDIRFAMYALCYFTTSM